MYPYPCSYHSVANHYVRDAVLVPTNARIMASVAIRYVKPLAAGLGIAGKVHGLSVLVEAGVPDIRAIHSRSAYGFALRMYARMENDRSRTLMENQQSRLHTPLWPHIRAAHLRHHWPPPLDTPVHLRKRSPLLGLRDRMAVAIDVQLSIEARKA